MKEVCIFNYTSSAAVYGIGTYIKEYVYCLKNIGCKINLIELGTDKLRTEFYINEEGIVRTIHFPYLLKWNIDNYNEGVCRLLRLYFEDSENLIFHFHYIDCVSSLFLDNLKKYFPLSKLLFTIHYLLWSAMLKGNVSLFETIICNRENKITRKKYGFIIDNFEKEKSILEKIDRIVCLSDDTFNLIQNQYGIKQHVWLIPNGLRKKFRNLSEKQKMKLREQYHISNNEKILLFVGRIDHIKGIEQVMACFNDVVKEFPKCRLVVIGDGNIIGLIRNCKKAYSKVIFTGRLDKKSLNNWYQIADIALFPSFYEECSYVGIEMMMHGLPIIASDGYSVKNMFHERINAKIAKIEKWTSMLNFQKNLKENILYVLNFGLLELELKKGSQKAYQVKYRIDHMQNRYAELLNSL